MRQRPFQLERGHRRWLYGVFTWLFLSGFSTWLTHQAMEDATQPVIWAETTKPWLLKIHGAAVMVFLITLGTVLMAHARRAWPTRINRGSGLFLSGWISLQIVTGYGLYYFGGEKLRGWTETTHSTLGLLAPIIIGTHVLRGRILARRSRPQK